MPLMSTGNTGKHLNAEWHRMRWKAETETFSIEEWGEIDRVKWDLDTVDFTRQFKDSTYETEARIETEGAAQGGVDVRTLDDAR